jgi:hypothetical protein
MDNKRYDYRTPIQIIVDHMQCTVDAPDRACRGYIMEISASGCRIESEREFHADDELTVSFVLSQGHSILDAKIKIIRPLGRDKKMFISGGQFVNLSEQDESKIREFVVWREAQREGNA